MKAEQFQQLWQILAFVKNNFQELFPQTSWFLTKSKLKLPECLRGAKQTQQLPLTLLQFPNRRRVSFQFNTSCKNVSNYKLYVTGGFGDGLTQLQIIIILVNWVSVLDNLQEKFSFNTLFIVFDCPLQQSNSFDSESARKIAKFDQQQCDLYLGFSSDHSHQLKAVYDVLVTNNIC